MPWRLIGFILTLAVVTTFIGFNLGNACDVSFGFVTIPQVPVYLTIFASFAAGMIAVVPYALAHGARKKKEGKTARSGRAGRSQSATVPRGRRDVSQAPDTELDDGAYGVD